MGNTPLQQKLWFFTLERQRVHATMLALIRAENGRTHQSSSPAAQAWNELQAEYARIGQVIRDVEMLLARYKQPD